MNPVYFIGAGPGDPELLTLAGARAIAACPSLFVPPPFDQTFAPLLAGKRLLVPFDFYFAELLTLVQQLRAEGPIGFLVPGDLTFYSPFQALVDALGDQCRVLPGVGTANAASAHLRKTFDLPGVCSRTVLVSPRTLGDRDGGPTLAELAAPGVTLLIYMNNLPLPRLAEELARGFGRRDIPIALLHRLGLPGERVVSGTLATIAELAGDFDFFNLAQPTARPALTLVVAGETLAATTDGRWWDYRREHIWAERERP